VTAHQPGPSHLGRHAELLVVPRSIRASSNARPTPLSPKLALHWNGVQCAERSARNLADFNGTAHRDVKLFVLHGKVTQFQRAHDDCVRGCLIRGRQGPNRFEEVDVQP
jgi:hypothetical protein